MKTLYGKELIELGINNTKLKKKLGEKCVYCGCTNKLVLTIDHKKPRVRGGEDIDKNKQVTCMICNWLKGGLTPTEFKKYYYALGVMKDLIKINLVFKDIKILFNSSGHPKLLKDIKGRN